MIAPSLILPVIYILRVLPLSSSGEQLLFFLWMDVSIVSWLVEIRVVLGFFRHLLCAMVHGIFHGVEEIDPLCKQNGRNKYILYMQYIS